MAILFGNTGANTINGTDGIDVILAFGGNDTVDGGAGSDFIAGGRADDEIAGGAGNDVLEAGRGSDTITGGAGSDVILGNRGIDTARFAGDVRDYRIDVVHVFGFELTVERLGAGEVDWLAGIEILAFDNGTFHLDGRNNAPIADDVAVDVGEDGAPLDLDLLSLSEAFDFEGDPLSIASVETNAQLSFDPVTGAVVYAVGDAFQSLAAGETAAESFAFEISDGTNTITRTLTVTIAGANDAPVAGADGGAGFTTDEDMAFTTAGVLLNDTDVDASDVLAVSALDATGTQGLVTNNGDGTFDYDPNGQFESLAAGESATEMFSYTISDGNGGTDTATVTVTIAGVNDAPVAEDDTAATDENTAVAIASVLANDTDVDASDVLSVGALDATGTAGTVTDNGDGTFGYDPNGQFESLAAGETATDTFSYTVSDGNGGTATATVTVTISGVNDAPVAGADGGAGFTTDEDTALTTASVLLNDTDVDASDVLSVGAFDTTGTLGLVTNNGDGTFGYDPNGQFESLAAGESATDTFSYTVSDGKGGTDTATVTVTISGVNDAPVAGADGGAGFTTDEDTTFTTASVLLNDTDVDASDVLSVGALDATSTAGLVTDNGDGTFGYDPNGQFESLAAGESATDTFRYTVSDGNGGTATATVTVTISGVNDAPVAGADGGAGFTTDEDTAFTTASVLANDTDVDASDILSVSAIDTTGTLGLVTDNGDGTFGYDPNGQFESLAAGESATDTFSYTVSDGQGGTDTATVTVTITGINDRTVIDLTGLSASDGFVIQGDAAGDIAGDSVSTAGDVNGDGFDDLIVGAPWGDDGGDYAGEAYVVFGKSSGFGTIDLTGLAASDGFVIQGDEAGDNAGYSVSSAGDVNGDGFDDLIVGAPFGGDGVIDAGEAYVVFGKSGGFATIDLSSFSVSDGFVIQGDAEDDNAGRSVSSAGDVNGDGFDDLIVGAPRGDDGGTDAGEAYVVFGRSGTFATIDLSSLSASDGFVIQGDAAFDSAGSSVSTAGDVNGDGFDDLIVGAPFGEVGGSRVGEAYVIFGKSSGFGTVIDLTGLSTSDGFVIQGDAAFDFAGSSVSTAGDVNGDGFDDLIVGAPGGSDGGTYAGEAYVVFGKSSGFGTIALTGLSASDGFVIQGDAAGDSAGFSVSTAGDVNGDGFDDLIVGAPGGGDGGSYAGEAYVVFGKSSGFGTIDLTGLSATDGFVIQGDAPIDQAGFSVSSAGDVNGDGFDDLIVGAPFGDDGGPDAGEAYVVFGGAFGGGVAPVAAAGTAAAEALLGGLGVDAVELAGSGRLLDFTAVDSSSRLPGVEAFDPGGSGANTFVLNAPDPPQLSDETHDLRVLGAAAGQETIEEVTVDVDTFAATEARLLAETGDVLVI